MLSARRLALVTGPSKRRLRIGVLLENGLGHRPHDEVVAATDNAVKVLSGLGHHIDYTHSAFMMAASSSTTSWRYGRLGAKNTRGLPVSLTTLAGRRTLASWSRSALALSKWLAKCRCQLSALRLAA